MLEDDFQPKVAPDASTPKVIGTLNIIFGLGLLACSLCYGFYALSLAMVGMAAQMGRAEVIQRIEVLKSEVQSTQAKLEATKDESEREEFQSRINDLQTTITDAEESLQGFDVMQGAGFNDPRYVFHFVADVASSWILNILLLISGAGLLGLREWARKLCIGVSWIKILRLALLALSGFIVVSPLLSDMIQNTIQSATSLDARFEAKRAGEAAEQAAARARIDQASSDVLEQNGEPGSTPDPDKAFNQAVERVVEDARDAQTPPPDQPRDPASLKNEIRQEVADTVAEAQDELKNAADELKQIAGKPPVPAPPAGQPPIAVQIDPEEQAQILQASRAIGLMFGAYSIGMLVLGSIYPVLCIILLNRPAVKSAFEIQKRMQSY